MSEHSCDVTEQDLEYVKDDLKEVEKDLRNLRETLGSILDLETLQKRQEWNLSLRLEFGSVLRTLDDEHASSFPNHDREKCQGVDSKGKKVWCSVCSRISLAKRLLANAQEALR